MERWESRKYLNEARNHTCVLCASDGIITPVHSAAHLPHAGYGMAAGIGQKTHDWLTAHLCADHHERMDAGDMRNDYQMRMRALCLTLERMFHEGVLGCPPGKRN